MLKYFQSCLVLVCCHGNELKLCERGHFTNDPLLHSNETFVKSSLTENTSFVNFLSKAWIHLSEVYCFDLLRLEESKLLGNSQLFLNDPRT